jgi:hypothetical protein
MKAKIIARKHTVIMYTLNGKKQYIVEVKESCKNRKREAKLTGMNELCDCADSNCTICGS